MSKKSIYILIVIIILLGSLFFIRFRKPKSKDINIDEIIEKMTTEEKIAQMIMPSMRGDSILKCDQKYIDLIEKYDFGGIILFKENIDTAEQTIDLINCLQKSTQNSKNKIPLFIGVDQEGGSVTRLTTGTSFSGNMAITATDNKENAYKVSKAMGEELKALGFNLDFAPSLDINNNPNNPVIGIRSFSDDSNIVSEYGNSFIKGLKESNIIPTLKHFPGHGDTQTDSHIGLPVINKNYDELKNNELIPFKNAIDNGADMIMTAHIMFPNIEKEKYISKNDKSTVTIPSTLSKTIITDILRNDLGYQGVVITDALDMKAITDNFNKLDVPKLAINAGVDILLMPIDFNANSSIIIKSYIEKIVEMINNKEIDINNVNTSVKRILTLKKKYNLLTYKESNIEKVKKNALKIVGNKEHHDLEWEIAKQSITLIKNDNNILPIKPNKNDNILILYAYENEYNSIKYGIQKLKENKIINDNIKFNIICYRNKNIDEFYNDIDKASYIIASIETSNTQDIKTGWQSSFVDKVINYAHQKNKKVILSSINLPYDVARHQNADAIITSYLAKGMDEMPKEFNGNTKTYGPNIPASIYMLFNKNLPTGKLPVNIYKLDKDYNYTNEILYPRGQ